MQSSTKKHVLLVFNNVQNFLFAFKLSAACLQDSNIYKESEIILKFVVLSISLARSGAILPVILKITRIKKTI